jgi:tetratricopeptide (TPR) repeat protein
MKPPTRVSRPSLMEPLPPTPETVPLLAGVAGAVIAYYAGTHAWIGALLGLAAGFGLYELMRRAQQPGIRRLAILPWEFNVRGLRYRNRGDLDAAAREYEAGIALHPRNAAMLYNAACVASLRGEHDRARHLLNRAVDRDPRARRWAVEDHDLAATMAAWPANAQSA